MKLDANWVPCSKLFKALTAILGIIVLQTAPALSSERGEIEERIERHKQLMEEGKESLGELSREEERVYSALVEIEERIEVLDERLREQRERLQQEKEGKEELEKRGRELLERIGDKEEELRELLDHLWPLWVQNQDMSPLETQQPEQRVVELDWLTSVYGMIRERMTSLRAKRTELQQNLEDLDRARKRIAMQIEEKEETQESLLQEKLSYSSKLQEIRAERLAKREKLEEIRETIQELQYRLEHVEDRQLSELKGHLTWPVQGDMIAEFKSDSSRESEKGMAFSLNGNRPVRAISWGKVVYDDKLRGFGRVVIIFHGEDYYSLYAYLRNTSVSSGQDVEKGQAIGRAGFYPTVDGPGLYFELRHGQDPIDPQPWLE